MLGNAQVIVLDDHSTTGFLEPGNSEQVDLSVWGR